MADGLKLPPGAELDDSVKLPPGAEMMGGAPATPPPAQNLPQSSIPKNYGFTPGNVLGNVWEGAKGMVGGAYSLGKDLVNNPNWVEGPDSTLNKFVKAPMDAQVAKAGNDFASGNKMAAYGHVLAGSIPLIGPWAGSLGEQAGTGDIGGAAGNAAGTIGTGAAVSRGLSAAKNISIPKLNEFRGNLAQKVVSPLTYENVGETAADNRMGANPERGLVNEGIVGTKKGIVRKIDQRLGQLKDAANNRLAQYPGAKINAEPLIDQAVDEAVASARKSGSDTSHLEDARQALKQEHGILQGNPRQINDLKTSIQGSADELGAYKNTQPKEASKAQAMRGAAQNIRGAVNSAAPEAVDLNQRMQDLMDARNGVQRKIDAARGDDIFDAGGHRAGMLGKTFQRTIGSAPIRTGLARMLNYGNVKPVPEMLPVPETPPIPRPAPGEIPQLQRFPGGGGSVYDSDVMGTINRDLDRRFGKREYAGPERRKQ